MELPLLRISAYPDMVGEDRLMAQRMAVLRLLGEILAPEPVVLDHDERGAPLLRGLSQELYLSISHTEGYVGVLLGSTPVGLDIELRGEQVERIHQRFLDEREITIAKQSADFVLALHLFWSAKEAAFKCHNPIEGVITVFRVRELRQFSASDYLIIMDYRGELIEVSGKVEPNFVYCYTPSMDLFFR